MHELSSDNKDFVFKKKILFTVYVYAILGEDGYNLACGVA